MGFSGRICAVSAVSLFWIASSFAEEDDAFTVPTVDPQPAADVDAFAARVTAPSASFDSPHLAINRTRNGNLADKEAAMMRTNVGCATWAVTAVSVPAVRDQSTSEWKLTSISDATAGGLEVELFASGTPSDASCSQLQNVHQNSIGDWRILDAGQDEPALVLYAAKFQDYEFRYTAQQAGAELEAAAQKCIYSGLPVDDLADWPPCLVKNGMGVDGSKVAYFEVIEPNPAFTFAGEVPDRFPMAVQSIALSSQGATRTLTLVAIAN